MRNAPSDIIVAPFDTTTKRDISLPRQASGQTYRKELRQKRRFAACRSGRFHILSHNGQIHTGGSNLQPGGDCGRHLFSATGSAGTWFGVPNSTLPNALGGCAYPRVNVTWADGSVKHFSGRERPHLIFGSDHDDDAGGGGGGGGVPVALTNAVIDSTDLPTYLYDKAYTLVQPINTKK